MRMKPFTAEQIEYVRLHLPALDRNPRPKTNQDKPNMQIVKAQTPHKNSYAEQKPKKCRETPSRATFSD